MTTSLRVLVSADMEGISGIVHPAETQPGALDYERGRVLMTAEVNAVVAGIMDVVPAAAVTVADAHGTFRNILPDTLDRRVSLVRGRPRPGGMMAGLDATTDAVMFVGYHGRSGSGPAVLAHTMSPMLLDVRLNGQPVGEIGANAFLAGHHGAPVAFLSGDALACEELNELVPGAVTVAVKEALGQASARTRHPELAREQIREAAATAVRRLDQVHPVVAEGPVELEMDLYRPHVVDLACLIPGVVRRDGARTVAFTARDMAEAYRVIELVTALGQIEVS